MSYDKEDNYKTLNNLIKVIEDYIYYYNYEEIKEKRKGLLPIKTGNNPLIRNDFLDSSC